MPFVRTNDIRLFYRLEGNHGLPVLILSHSISTDHQMWAPQAQDLLPHFQILRYDTRGHGASDASAGDYTVEQLGRDVLALADSLSIPKFAFCGLSLGGAIGQWLAIHVPERLTHLVLANTSPAFTPRSRWEERIAAAKKGGMAGIADLAMQRFFSADFLAAKNPYVSGIRSVLLGTDAVGYLGCCAALRDLDHTHDLQKVHGEVLAREISGAKAVHLPAAHLSNLERPRSFTAALLEFLQPATSHEDATSAGFKVRREVLGDAHVDRAIAATTDLTREFQALITRYAWGAIWTRPALDHRTRRLLVLAMTAALGRWEEFRLHLRAGLAHELEPSDLKEMLLQTAIYAGVPAANTGFHIAEELLSANKN